MSIKMVQLTDAIPTVAHYSPAVVFNGLIFVSGQVPDDPITGEKKRGSIEEQTEQCLRNIERVLLASDSDLNHLLKTTAYITNIALWDGVNATYRRILGDHLPARAVIPVGDFGNGMLIEIEAIACVRGS